VAGGGGEGGLIHSFIHPSIHLSVGGGGLVVVAAVSYSPLTIHLL